MSSWTPSHQKGRARFIAIASILSCLCLNFQDAKAGYVVGVDFAAQDQLIWFLDPLQQKPVTWGVFNITDSATGFARNGALAGYTETETRLAVVDSVQQMFRSAEISVTGRMLDVNILYGAVAPSIGTWQLVGDDLNNRGTAGEAYYDGAHTRPDLVPGSGKSNLMSVTAADAVSSMPGVSFTTFDQVINSIAGTVAHEIAHTLGVLNHDPGAPVNGVYSIMASGASTPSLPVAARLTQRQFLNVAGTQPGGLSTTQVLLSAAGTTSVTDFNFDHATDGSDYSMALANLGRTSTGVKTGDANNDRVTDGSDYNLVLASLGTLSDVFVGDLVVSSGSPQFTYDSVTGILSVNADALELGSILITGPAALSRTFTTDSLAQGSVEAWQLAGGGGWVQGYFNDKEQWIRLNGASLNTSGGYLELATFAAGLAADSFGSVEYGYQADLGGTEIGWTSITVVPEPASAGLITWAAGLILLGGRRISGTFDQSFTLRNRSSRLLARAGAGGPS